MKELEEISKKLNEIVEELRENNDVEKAVAELHEIRDKLKKIIKESTWWFGCIFAIFLTVYMLLHWKCNKK